MNITELLKELHLPPGSYIIVGSGILAALGIRETHDIDILVTDDIYEQYKAQGWQELTLHDHFSITNGVYDIGKTYGGKSVDYWLQRATFIDDIPYVSLQDLRAWKVTMGREKDLADIKLIDEYLLS